MPKYLISGIMVALFLLGGCAKNRVEGLTERAKKYNQSVRWGSVAAAGTLMAEDVRRSMVSRLADELSENRITDFTIVDLGLDQKQKQGSVIVQYKYFSVNQEVLRARQELQVWKYSSGTRNWYLHEVRNIPTQR